MAIVGDIVKVHIHTKAPGLVLQQGLSWGTLHDIKIDNMAEQHEHRVMKVAPAEKRGLAVLAVAAGSGIATIMHQAGRRRDHQRRPKHEPAGRSLYQGHRKRSAEQYIILPNNKNIILAAEQVQKLLGAAR